MTHYSLRERLALGFAMTLLLIMTGALVVLVGYAAVNAPVVFALGVTLLLTVVFVSYVVGSVTIWIEENG